MFGGMKLEADVRPMAPDETVQTALLHTRELPHEFLTRFGPEFLYRYYRAFIESPYAVALVAGVDGEPERSGGQRVDGVLLGTFDTGAHYWWPERRLRPGRGADRLRSLRGGRPEAAGTRPRRPALRGLRGAGARAGLRRLELVTLPDERGAAPFFERMGWRRGGEVTSRSGERYAFSRDLGG